MKNLLNRKYVNIALLILIGGILAYGAIWALGGNNKLRSDGTKEATVNNSPVTPGSSGLNETVKDAPRRKAYPIGNWEVAIPYLNPFGSQSNYQSVKLLPNQYQELRYIDTDNRETSRMTSGTAWQMQVEWTDKTVDPFDDLNLYVAELGGEFYRGPDEDKWVIHAADSAGDQWWGVASKNGGGYLLTVYQELKLQQGKTVTFKAEDFKNQEIYFMTTNEGHKYQSIKATLTDGEMQVTGRGVSEQGQYRRDILYTKWMYAYKTKDYMLNDIPQDSSVPILWKVTWRSGSEPGEISFTLDEGEDISPFRDGERLGALRVRGNMLGSIQVAMSPGVTMSHPELNLQGDKTPEGDMLFWLPAGYWNVKATQRGGQTGAIDLNTRMIPVSSGEMTELEIKPLLANSYNNDGLGDATGDESLLKMETIAEQGEQAKIDFMLLDSRSPKYTPTPADIQILEGGQPGKILKLERLQIPPSVVLALDSSGSMAKSMEQVLESARTFIQGLPENAHVQVIDFDSDARLLPGTGKKEVLESLKQVKAKGNTALYDSVVQGLDLLKEKQRPTMVVFSDGVDSSAEKAGTGSKATKQEVVQAVKASGIPLFTIGFGPDHDSATLLELAGMSEGTYYSAKDAAVLTHVFTSINDRLGNQFELTYERPKEQAPSDAPVISLTMDISGSMDMSPASGEGNYRIDKMKYLFHDFIGQLPENSLMQLISFSAGVSVEQVLTHRKSEVLQSLGNLGVGTGTNILDSVSATYRSLRKVPSDKRVMVYLTDAALDVDSSQKETFEKILTGIKQEGIQVLWVGMGTGEGEEAFKWAADKSGGKYVISEDPQVLAKAFQEALAEVKRKPAEKVALSLAISNDSEQGAVRQYTDSQLVDFPVRLNVNDRITLDTISYEAGKKIMQYELATASLVYGQDIPSKDVKIYKRIPLSAKGKNKAAEWNVRELYFLKRLKGVDAPTGKSFAAVDMDIKNIYGEGVPYLIPDFASHFFMNVNESGSYPASTATWLTETPIAPPGEGGITIGTDETKRGMLVFLVPDEKLEQVSLNYYDTTYGHVTLLLVGNPPKQEELAVTKLPTSVTGKLSDTFNLTVKASSDTEKIEKVELKRKTSVFKVIEAELQSNVQADLKMDPAQRFYLSVKSGKGPFLIPVNTATALLPYGLLRPVTMGPGSSNKIRFAFQTPNVLKDKPTDLYVDLYGGATVLPIRGKGSDVAGAGSAGSGTDNAAGAAGVAYQGDGVALTVNALARIKSLESGSGGYVVADVTIADTKDGSGTSGFRESLKLVASGGQAGQSADERQELSPDRATDDLLLGIDKDWAVFDGASRRGFLIFALPSKQADLTWELQSDQFGSLKLPVAKDAFQEEGLLVKRVSPELDRKFDIQLSAALTNAIRQHQALAAAQSSANAAQAADLDAGSGPREAVPAPLPTVHGLMQMQSVKTLADFQALINGLKWLPSPDYYYMYRNSPEAVLTQGWGTEGDLANLTGGLLAKLGYGPSLRMVKLTDQGRQALQELGGVDKAEQQFLPAWSYSDEEGKTKVFVVPFMKDLSELSGLVFLPAGQESRSMTPVQGTISVYYKIKPKENKGVNAVAGDVAGALGGGESGGDAGIQEVRVLNTSLDLDLLSKEAVDIRAGGANGLYTAVLENQTVQIVGDQQVDPRKFNVTGVRIEVQLPKKKLVHETKLQEGEEISGVFHTLVVNLPDLSSAATGTVQKAADRAYQAAKRPDDQSTLVWYTRNILYRFIASQTAYEDELARTLDVTAGRTNQERVIVVTVRAKGGSSQLRTSIDLQQSANMLHRSTKESASAFQIMSGLFASRLEGAVLPGNSADFMEVWSRSPDDTKLILSLPANRKEDLKSMEEKGFPELLLQRAKDSSKAMLIPDQATRIYGENRWAWLEIDPETYETIAVMDTGEHGGFADYLMALEPVSPTGDDYLVFMTGAFIGVSSSVWSVSAFSLMLDNYKQIIREAKKYTYGLGSVLSDFMDNKDLIKLEYYLSPLKLKMADAEFDYLAKHFEEVQIGKEVKGSADIVNFGNGFNAGAAYYFKQAEAAQ